MKIKTLGLCSLLIYIGSLSANPSLSFTKLIPTSSFVRVIGKTIRSPLGRLTLQQSSKDGNIYKEITLKKQGEIIANACYTLEKPTAHLKWVGVSPAYQRQGLGTTLISSIYTQTQQQGCTTLELDSLEESCRFYHKLNAIPQGVDTKTGLAKFSFDLRNLKNTRFI